MSESHAVEEFLAMDSSHLTALGRQLTEHQDSEQLVAWVAGLLNEIIEASSSEWADSVVGEVLELANNRSSWAQGKEVFRKVRSAVNRLAGQRESVEEAILLLSEIAAKLAWNASKAGTSFDSDTQFWVPHCVQRVVASSSDHQQQARLLKKLGLSPEDEIVSSPSVAQRE